MSILSSYQQLIRHLLSICVLLFVAACAATGISPSVGPTPANVFDPIETQSPANTTIPTPIPSLTVTSIPVASGLSSVSYALPLTVQHVTNTTAELHFELTQPVDGMLTYHAMTGDTSERILPFDASTPTRQLFLDGLAAGVEYQASIVLKDADGQVRKPGFLGEDWGDVSFRTWDERQPLRFGIIGDSGFGDSVTPQLTAQMAESNPDFALQIGDIVYHVDENRDPFEAFALKFYRPFSSVLHRMPVYPVVGNHDVEYATLWQGAPFYNHAFPPIHDPRFDDPSGGGKDWYAFSYGSVQFLMLNTEAMNNSQLRSEQKAWLADRLADARFSLSIPVFHITPYSAGLHVNDGVAVQADWVPLFEQSGLKLVLTAHDHNYQRFNVNGITYLVSGGGSAVLYENTLDVPGLQMFNRVSHFVAFEVYPDRIDFKAVALGGEVIDQQSIPLQ